MGLDINGTKFLLFARQLGVSFAETAMIGRQEMLISPKNLRSNLKAFGLDTSADETEKLLTDAGNYSEPFFELLGASEIVSFDASTYENASVTHDFNLPIPVEYKGKFSVVLDGGTLEHIFNFPVAIKNCMEMVADGGHFLAIAPANNYLGHGFYQFSPELFFRIFSAENGFRLEKLMLFEETSGCSWYEVADPEFIKERVTLVNGRSSLMLVVAKKLETVDVLAMTPQQSDYLTAWETGQGRNRSKTRSKLFSVSPMSVLRRAGLYFDRRYGMLNRLPKHFKKVDLP